jgi:hypothetical protein
MNEVQRVLEFVEDHSEISDLSTDAAEALMKIPDPIVQQKAISHVANALNRKTPTGGSYKKRLTKPEVEKVIEKVSPPETVKKESCVLKPSVSEKIPEKKKPSDAFCYQPGEAPKASDAPCIKPLSAVLEEPAPVQHVNPGPAVMVNPVVIDDSKREAPGRRPNVQPVGAPYRESFKTAAEVLAHDRDPLGIGPAPADPVPAAPAEKIDPAKELKERRNRLAKELATTYSERTQRDIQDLIHENPTWRNEEADVFYFGIEALRNPPKVSVSAGSMIRR